MAGPEIRSGRPGASCCATAKTSPTPSSSGCGTRYWTRARSARRCWWPEIEAFLNTGISNAKSEGINRVIKFVGRSAYGFRTPTNQRLRARCVTTRRARGHLRTA
ncbi:hypothetical protein GCM10023080_011180 [Streptomyces pseudoechinosporeus]